jgi:site-specific DNA-methyltransferase (adenine-specific)
VNADCFDVFPFIEDKSIDAIICDLPYGTTILNWDKILPITELWKHYNRILKDNGVVVLFGAEPFSTMVRSSNILNYKYDWIWQKTRPSLFQHANKRPMKDHENIMVFYKKQPTYNQELKELEKPNKRWRKNKMGAFLENGCNDVESKQTKTGFNRQILTYAMHNVGMEHKTQKPIELLEFLVKTYTSEGDIVLDNTMGSGTTNLACIKLNRKSIGIEKEKQYYDVAVRRASDYLGSNIYKNIQTKENYDKLLSSGMFWEFHPELSGNWDADRSVVQYCH